MTDRLEKIARAYLHQHADGLVYTNLQGDLAPENAREAYAAQSRLHEICARSSKGPLGGRKIALASKVQQQLCNVDHPVAGGIFRSAIHSSPASVTLADYHGLGIEFELAARIKTPLSPSNAPFSKESVVDHVGSIHPAFELIIDREADYQNLDALSMIADNCWNGGVVLGDAVAGWQDLDLDSLPVTLFWNDEPPQTATSGMSDPMGSLAWVANLVTDQGLTIDRDEIVITGSVIQTRWPESGDRIRYQFDGHGDVSLTIK